MSKRRRKVIILYFFFMLTAAAVAIVGMIGIWVVYFEAKETQNMVKGQHEEKIALLNQMIEKKSQQNAHAVVDLDIFFSSMVWTVGIGILILILILFLRKNLFSATPTLKAEELDILTEENFETCDDKKTPESTNEKKKTQIRGKNFNEKKN